MRQGTLTDDMTITLTPEGLNAIEAMQAQDLVEKVAAAPDKSGNSDMQ